jgi:hypothetical protein
MARIGLRMMPTFPSPSLKFRTVGFPQYGFKASLSDRACRRGPPVKSVPDIPGTPRRLHLSFAGFGHHIPSGSESRIAGASACRCARGLPSLPQGSLAPVRVVLSRSLLAYSDPIRQSRRHAAISRPGRLYAAPSLCGHASATRETFPTFAAVLSARATDPTPAGPLHRPVAIDAAIPGCLELLANRHPQVPVSASNTRRGSPFLRCIVRVMLRLVRLPSPPGWLRPDGVTCAPPGLPRYRVTPAFGAVRRRVALGVRLDGRTGNLPSSGLAPDKSQQLVRLHNNAG